MHLLFQISAISGASCGIGRATAKLFAETGAVALIADIDELEGENLASETQSQGHKADFVKLDVTDEVSWIQTYAYIENKYQQLNILVNNAGIAFGGSITNTKLQDWRRLMAVNLDGVFLGMKLEIPILQKSGGGSIVNISSVSGLVGAATEAAF